MYNCLGGKVITSWGAEGSAEGGCEIELGTSEIGFVAGELLGFVLGAMIRL